MTETRRLAAIMAIDVVGYSRLMGEDEAGTARAVREHREAARPLVAGRGGRIVKTMGDGLLLDFPSVVDAVECAIAIQKLMVERNAETPEDKRIVYRIGVNLGDVLIEGDDILGEGVNIAARLEGIAEPGGVLISGTAFDHVGGKIDANFVDIGEKNLKNIGRPVRVFAFASGVPRPTASLPKQVTLSAPRLSIVVLPFTNLGGDPEQEYFVDGVTESLTTDLSRIQGAFAIGRNTSFTYKGKPVDLKQVGRELNVRYVLEGSVQRGGQRMRVNVQLIDAESGTHLWAERFDKPVADLFDMQDEIVARLANELEAQLTEAEARRAERVQNPDSTDVYFQGMAWTNKGATPDQLNRARNFFDRALEIDPGNVDALVGGAYAEAVVAAIYLPDDRLPRLAAAEAALTKALSLAPGKAAAHLWMGLVYLYTDRAARSIAQYERALELNRNLAAAHAGIGLAKYSLARFDETEPHIREALRISPRDTLAYTYRAMVGMANLLMGKEDEAIVWLGQSIETNRNYPGAHLFLGAAYAHLGRIEEARAAVAAGLALDPSFTIARRRAMPFSLNATYLKQIERFYEGLRLAGAPEA
jgi:TolB-like protein/class 3 adenylate cyclase/Flp pilus assembly protein TadD